MLRSTPVTLRLFGWTAVAQGSVLAVAVARRDIAAAAIAAAALGLMVLGPRATALAVAGAVLLGAWPVAAVAAACLLLHGLVRIVAMARSYDVDPEQLARAVTDLPPVLRPVDRTGLLTTSSLLDVARATRPGWWRTIAPLRQDIKRPDDGPLLVPSPSTGPCTQYAAEAISLARVASEKLGVPLDVHLLGAVAVLIPGSAAASRAAMDEPVVAIEKLTGAHTFQITDILATFAQERGGGAVLRRLDAEKGGQLPLPTMATTALAQAVHGILHRGARDG